MSGDILILGGNGFLGRAIAKRLADLHYSVLVVSRSEAAFIHPNIRHHRGSLDDATLLNDLLPQCETIIHLASTCTPATSANNPVRELEENLLPLLRLLEILSTHTPRHFIFISSGGTVYGNPTQLPVAEDAPLAPLSYHGAAKAAAELFLQRFANIGWPVTILRPPNIYGPGQPLKAGFGVIRTLLEHLKNGTKMPIWGDGTALRDYLYIDDFIDALIGLIQHKTTGVFNVGSGLGHTLNEAISNAEKVTGRRLELSRHPARSVDVSGIVLDCRKLNQATGWHPTTALESGILHTWQSVLQQP